MPQITKQSLCIYLFSVMAPQMIQAYNLHVVLLRSSWSLVWKMRWLSSFPEDWNIIIVVIWLLIVLIHLTIVDIFESTLIVSEFLLWCICPKVHIVVWILIRTDAIVMSSNKHIVLWINVCMTIFDPVCLNILYLKLL